MYAKEITIIIIIIKENTFFPTKQRLNLLMCVKKKINNKPNTCYHIKFRYFKSTCVLLITDSDLKHTMLYLRGALNRVEVNMYVDVSL